MIALSVFWVQSVIGQETSNKWQFKGNMGIYGDFYSMTSDTAGAIMARRPGSVGRLIVNSTLSYGKFSLPISLMLSAGQYSVVLPKAPKGNLLDFVRDPANRIGIAPKYKWIQVLLGSQVPQYSELSVGDLPVFGAGISLTPGKFRFSVFAGTSQLSIKEDTTRNIQGVFARKIYSAKIGFGKEDDSHIYLISSKLEDDVSSLDIKPLNTMPQNGILSSVDYKIKIGKQYYIKGEIAGSAFTRDSRNKEFQLTEMPFSIPSGIFKVKESSRFDYASVLSIAKDGKFFKLKVSGKYIGDGFVPMGYPFMQTDRLEVTIDPVFNLFKNKVLFTGSVGKRINNLSNIRASSTTQTIGFANLNIQFTQKFSTSITFSNFNFQNSIRNDTLMIDMVTLSGSISPTYIYTTAKNMHVFNILYSQNKFSDYNTISGALGSNDSRNGIISYMLSKINSPLNLSTLISYFENNTSFGFFTTKSLNINVGYKFFKKKLNTTIGLNYNENKLSNISSGKQTMARFRLKYKLNKKMDFSINGSVNLFKYGSDRPGISYIENLLRTSITYKF